MTYSVPVLLHGYLGFSHFGPIHYFRGVAQALKHEGVQCFTPAVPSLEQLQKGHHYWQISFSKVMSRNFPYSLIVWAALMHVT